MKQSLPHSLECATIDLIESVACGVPVLEKSAWSVVAHVDHIDAGNAGLDETHVVVGHIASCAVCHKLFTSACATCSENPSWANCAPLAPTMSSKMPYMGW